MTPHIRSLSVVMACAIALGAGAGRAFAQTKDNAVVWVVTADGQERKGRLVRFTPERLVLRVGSEERTIDMDTLIRVDTTDSISNGIRNGAITGAVFGGLGALALSTCDGCGAGAAAAGAFFVGFYTLAGAGLGALIDHAIQDRRPIFSRLGPSRVAVEPVLSPKHRGVQVSFRW
jgi:hypothetical protein